VLQRPRCGHRANASLFYQGPAKNPRKPKGKRILLLLGLTGIIGSLVWTAGMGKDMADLKPLVEQLRARAGDVLAQARAVALSGK
jgi:hypothetical protein